MRKHRTDLAYEEVLDLQDNENFTHTKKKRTGALQPIIFQSIIRARKLTSSRVNMSRSSWTI